MHARCNNCLSLFEGFSVLIWRSNLESKCDYVNKSWLQFTGRSLQQELDEGWLDGIHSDDVQRCRQIYLEAFSNYQSFEREYRLRSFNGEYRWVLDCAGPLFDRAGHFAGYIGYCYDITERKQAEAMNHQYRSLFSNARDVVFLIDHDGRILNFSNSAVTVYGYTKVELDGMNFHELLVMQDMDGIEEQFQQAIIHGNVYETVHRCKEGTVLPVELNITPSTIDGEQILFIVIRDITNRRQAEQEKLNMTSEKARNEKKASLATVAAGIAHEVNNPLTFIKMNAQLLERMLERQYNSEVPIEVSVDSYKRSIDAIVRGTERIADIVSGLKFFARQELREKTMVNVSKALKEAWTLVTTNQQVLNEVQLQSRIGSDIMVYGNRQQIEQVLINLLHNAVKAIHKSEHDQGTISIDANQQDCRAQWVVLTIADNGCGMESGVLHKIFEPFYTSDNEMGTGMGLAVVQGIVDEHGGTITVESQVGQGTMFTVRLPAIRQQGGDK